MTKREFAKWIKNMLKEKEEGYYGDTEIIDEIWDWIQFSYVLPVKKKKGGES